MKTLHIIRGLPGSGKSTLGSKLCPGRSYAADDFFETLALTTGKTYQSVFRLEDLPEAHFLCISRVRDAMLRENKDIAVCNTFSELRSMEPYKKLACDLSWIVSIVECKNNYGSVHNVPEDVIVRMRSLWQNMI